MNNKKLLTAIIMGSLLITILIGSIAFSPVGDSKAKKISTYKEEQIKLNLENTTLESEIALLQEQIDEKEALHASNSSAWNAYQTLIDNLETQVAFQ